MTIFRSSFRGADTPVCSVDTLVDVHTSSKFFFSILSNHLETKNAFPGSPLLQTEFMKNKNQRAPLPLNIHLEDFFRQRPFSPEKINESLANAQPFETHTYTQARNRPPSVVQKKKLTGP